MTTEFTAKSTASGRNAASLAKKEQLEVRLVAAIDAGRRAEAAHIRAELERLHAQVSLAAKVASKHAGGARGKERRAQRKLA